MSSHSVSSSAARRLAGLLIGAATALHRYAYVQDQWRRQVSAQAKSEVDALQARIRPHFLFNSMNTIASLVRIDPAKAERAVEDLSDLFRAALGAGERDSTLAEEVELVERFLAIESLRLGDRHLQLANLASARNRCRGIMKLPRLVLQATGGERDHPWHRPARRWQASIEHRPARGGQGPCT